MGGLEPHACGRGLETFLGGMETPKRGRVALYREKP